jgi:hypothetical protein
MSKRTRLRKRGGNVCRGVCGFSPPPRIDWGSKRLGNLRGPEPLRNKTERERERQIFIQEAYTIPPTP